MEDFDEYYYENIDDPEEPDDLDDFFDMQEDFFWDETFGACHSYVSITFL